ncbi:MAG TPA: porin [Candidatus Limnocylindrales bacterium]|nr:porin [Candidatus Limnocylindrales bacterium]
MKPPGTIYRARASLAAIAVACACGLMPASALAASPTKETTNAALLERIDALEEEIKQLKKDTRVLEVSDENRTKAKPVAGYQDGFFVGTADGKYKLKVGGYVHADSRWATDHADNPTVDSFTIRRARLDIRGTLAERFEFRLMPDFAGSSLVLQDAYLDTRFAPWAVLRTGKFKTPFGLERLQSATNLLFIERSLVDNLVPNRDLGVQVYGDVQQGLLGYQVAVLNGVVDGGSTDADVNDAVDVAARVFSHPFINTSIVPLRGLGIGVAATYGEEQGSASSPQLPQFRTSSRNTYFRYSADNPSTPGGTTIADGTHWRVSPQAYYYFGPFGSMFEYAYSSQDVKKDPVEGTVDNSAWQVRASYLVTGEAANYKQIVPNNNFGFGTGGWGAWELALRYASLDVDNDVFDKGFADKTRSVTAMDSLTAAVNWYLNKNVMWALNFEHSTFAGGDKDGGDRHDEDVFLTRVQFVF